MLMRLLSKYPSLKPYIESALSLQCRFYSALCAKAHRRLRDIQWGIPPQPEHFDHAIDLFYQWRADRNPLWLERGVYGCLVQKSGNLLELACGDGFNARNFYSLRARHVLACDFDKGAVAVAKQKNAAPNIDYVLADIRHEMPEGLFDNVMWDGAIEHFTPEEIDKVLRTIKLRLAPGGVLSGYTLVEGADGVKANTHHEYEFRSKQDLLRFLTPHFKHVTVFETEYPNRHNLYFWASDGTLPFRPDWRGAVTEQS